MNSLRRQKISGGICSWGAFSLEADSLRGAYPLHHNVKENGENHINPLDYGLSRTEFRHLKVLDLLDENVIKPLEYLKDDPKTPKTPLP